MLIKEIEQINALALLMAEFKGEDVDSLSIQYKGNEVYVETMALFTCNGDHWECSLREIHKGESRFVRSSHSGVDPLEAFKEACKEMRKAAEFSLEFLTFAEEETSEKNIQLLSDHQAFMSKEDLKDSVEAQAAKLGVPLNFNHDEDLDAFRMGRPLLLGELEAMPDGSVVWARYQRNFEEGYRVDGPFRISHNKECWNLRDGSSFGAEFETSEKDPGEPCFDDCCGRGEMTLWHVIKEKL